MRLAGIFFVISLAALFAPLPAAAVEALSAQELAEHCRHYDEEPEGLDGVFCVRYVQGFIDGAVATDERVTNNVADEFNRSESFSERAIRTRVGNRLKRFGPSVYAEFCLGAPVPLAEVVEKVVNSLQTDEQVAEYANARDLVYGLLRAEYPCEAGE